MRACAPLKASFQMRLACIRLLSAARKTLLSNGAGGDFPPRISRFAPLQPVRRPPCGFAAGLSCESPRRARVLHKTNTVPNFSRFMREKSHQRAFLCVHRCCASRKIDKRARCPPSGRWLGGCPGRMPQSQPKVKAKPLRGAARP